MYKSIRYLLFIFLLIPFNVFPDIITLKSGQKIEGKIISQDEKSLMVDFEGVELRYYNEDIAAIDKDSLPKKQEPAVIEQQPVKPSEDHFDQGMAYLQDQRVWEAIAAFNKQLAADPSDVKSAYNIAGAYLMMGKFEDAARWYQKTKELEPGNINAYIGLGIVYRMQSKYTEAIESLTQAFNLDKKNILAAIELAVTYHAIEDWQSTLQWCKAALTLEDTNSQAHYFMGMAYGRLGRYEEAADALRSAVYHTPDYADAYLALGATLFAANKDKPAASQGFDEARQCLLLAKQLYQDSGNQAKAARADELLRLIDGN